MKIDLSKVDREQFMVHESTCYGEPLYLIQPQHIGAKWTRENRIFRSSIWNSEGELVSAGLPKFVNWGEAPDVFPVPTSLKGCVATEKIDGSLLIVSKYRGQLIKRTRGTFDASIHDNAKELEELFQRYPRINFLVGDTYSVLLEWVSPENRIVLNYGEQADLFLVGIVYHEDYGLADQGMLDEVARTHNLKRPTTHKFDSIDQLVVDVEQWKGKEGICLYSKHGQEIHKIKGKWYLDLHHLKSEISSVEKLVDVYLNWNMPEYQEFQKKIEEIFDYELFLQVQGDVSKICEAKKEADQILDHMRVFVHLLKVATRKDAAMSIIGAYGQTIKTRIAFNLLDGKDPDNKSWKKLILQSLGR